MISGRQWLVVPGGHNAAARSRRPHDDDLRVGERSGERAAAAHGQHEARTGQADKNWPDWYAEYMVREQSGKKPE
ncbi:hypothetical protein [Nitrosospira sp. Nsp14]|uniref:hypothetical protein n=1 Tax=Nitrosospira sp. Nsp14 TaxID=1855333 RepID=UPI001C434D77|nr:hypothetical protein [Nitrosospira sp. Nsp14]